jgi:hypothetical protein
MKVLSYDTLARNFRKAWATIESSREEVIVRRNGQQVARILPEPARAGALAIFGDLHGTLGEQAGGVLARKVAETRRRKRHKGTLHELRNPWAS